MRILGLGAVFTAARGPLGLKIKGSVSFDHSGTLKIVKYRSKQTGMPNFMLSSNFAGWFPYFPNSNLTKRLYTQERK